jgi:hypothetical protein
MTTGGSKSPESVDPLSADLPLSIQPQTPMKTKDAKKETKKKPAKTPQEKKLAKREKKNSR